MADDFDVEALLEAPFKKEVNGEGESTTEEPMKNGEDNGDDTKSGSGSSSSSSDGEGKRAAKTKEREKSSERGGGGGGGGGAADDRKTSGRHRSRSKRRSKSPRRSSKSRHRSQSKSRHRSRSPRRRGSRSPHRSKSRASASGADVKAKRRSRSKHRSRSPAAPVTSRHRKAGSRSPRRSRSKRRSRSPPRKRSRTPPPPPPKRRSRSKQGSRSRDRVPPFKKRSRSRSRDRKRRRKSLTPISLPGRREGPPPYSRYRKASPIGPPPPVVDDLTPEERDARTIFCMQLSQKIRAKDLEEFFSSVGKVRDVRLITCNKTRRFKGIAYIEFKDPESVALALGLNGQKLLSIPIVVQPTQAEKNRMGNSMPNLMPRNHPGPVRLYVGSLHYNITEDMLRGIFEPFGKIDSIMLMTDPETGRSKGYGFVTYHNSEDAKKALEQMNGFELAGRPMKVNNVTERHEFNSTGPSIDETDERAGIDLGATGRLQLMYKLAEGTGMQIPPAAASALNLNPVAPIIPQATPAPPIATQCFLLANMFDPNSESAPNWEQEIKDDVIEECNRHGGCVHVFVDKASPQGNVYVKCPTITTAVAAVNSLHGRWFGGRIITAAYVPVINYHNLFPETITSSALLAPSRKAAA